MGQGPYKAENITVVSPGIGSDRIKLTYIQVFADADTSYKNYAVWVANESQIEAEEATFYIDNNGSHSGHRTVSLSISGDRINLGGAEGCAASASWINGIRDVAITIKYRKITYDGNLCSEQTLNTKLYDKFEYIAETP